MCVFPEIRNNLSKNEINNRLVNTQTIKKRLNYNIFDSRRTNNVYILVFLSYIYSKKKNSIQIVLCWVKIVDKFTSIIPNINFRNEYFVTLSMY